MARAAKVENKQAEIVQTAAADAASAWLIVRAISGKERTMMEYMRGQGFETYRPSLIKSRFDPIRRRAIVVSVPMFTGYVLVRPKPREGYRVFSMPYVFDVLSLALLDDVVVEIRGREKDGIISMLQPPKRLKRGEKVRTLGGLVDAIVSEPLDTNRVSLITGLFKGSARFTCSLDQVIKH